MRNKTMTSPEFTAAREVVPDQRRHIGDVAVAGEVVISKAHAKQVVERPDYGPPIVIFYHGEPAPVGATLMPQPEVV
jgi:hypothetical protein